MSPVTPADIENYQQQWSEAVVSCDIEKLMSLYDPEAILKPTVSSVIRRTPEDIKLYFVGGEKFSDKGFLNKEICKIFFKRKPPLIEDRFAIDVGEYIFTQKNGNEIQAHYTFCYKWLNAQLFIITQHSSLL